MKVTETYTSVLQAHVRFHIYSPEVILRNKAIISIHHGLTEHADLYESFAHFLVSKGFIVVVSDTIGHGKSLIDFEQGYFGEGNISKSLMEDMKHLFDVIRLRYPDLPYFLLGYDFGSTLVREFISEYGECVDGVILLSPYTRINDAFVKKAYLKISSLFYGQMHKPKLFYAFVNKMKNRRLNMKVHGLSWMAHENSLNELYLSDPMTHFVYTIKGYNEIFKMIELVNKDETINKTPKHLMMYIASGLEDPTIYKPEIIVDKYKKQGLDVTYHLFKNRRHAILLEENRQEVYYDIYNWLNDHIFM